MLDPTIQRQPFWLLAITLANIYKLHRFLKKVAFLTLYFPKQQKSYAHCLNQMKIKQTSFPFSSWILVNCPLIFSKDFFLSSASSFSLFSFSPPSPFSNISVWIFKEIVHQNISVWIFKEIVHQNKDIKCPWRPKCSYRMLSTEQQSSG